MEIVISLLIVGYVYLFFIIKKLQTEVATLTRQDQARHAVAAARPVVTGGVGTPRSQLEQSSITTVNTAVQPSVAADDVSHMWTWLQQDFLVKVGAVFLLLGIGWALNYAIANNWIGPLGRITLGLVFGTGMLMLGVWRVAQVRTQGLIFALVGTATTTLTVYAGFELYGLFTPYSALSILFLTSVVAAKIAVAYGSEKTALLAFVIAASAPAVIHNAQPDELILWSYLAAIVVGTLWVVTKIQSLALFLLTVFTVVVFAEGSYNDNYLILFGIAFSSLFLLLSLKQLPARGNRSEVLLYGLTMFMVIVQLLSWIMVLPDHWHSIVTAAWSSVYALGMYYVYKTSQVKSVMYTLGASSAGLLAAATSMELQDVSLVAALMVEVTAALMLVRYLHGEYSVARAVAYLYIPLILVVLSYIETFRFKDSLFSTESVVMLLSIFCLTAAALTTKVMAVDTASDDRTPVVLGGVSCVLALIWYWFANGIYFGETVGVTVSLVTFTIAGLMLMLYRPLQTSPFLRMVGKALLAFVIARVLLVDVWDMAIVNRVITFITLGFILISTAFLKRSK